MLNRSIRIPVLAVFIAACALAQPPAITPEGIVNAASHMPASLPGGKLAPGARFIVAGVRFDSQTSLHIENGAWSASLKPLSTTALKMEAALPPGTPMGELAVSAVNSEGRSRAEKVVVGPTTLGIRTMNGEGWGPALAQPVRPGEKVKLRVNGLNQRRPKVFVAGTAASGVTTRENEVAFTVPRKALAGCWTPVWIESEAKELSNFVTLAIRPGSGPCADSPWFLRPRKLGTRNGAISMQRISGSLEMRPGASQDFSFDSGSGFFFRVSTGELTPLQLLPPASACLTYTGNFTFDATQLLGLKGILGAAEEMLSIGSSLSIQGPAERHAQIDDAEGVPGFYSGLFGGTAPILWGPGTPQILEPGSYRLTSGGSAEIGKFETTVNVPPAFKWLNRSDVNEIDRKTGTTLQWSGLAPDRHMIIVAFSVDQDTSAYGTAVCQAPPKATQMTIPPYAFANFPATRPTGVLPTRYLFLMSEPASAAGSAPLKGLDEVQAVYLEIQGKSVRFR